MNRKSRFTHGFSGVIFMVILGMMFTQTNLDAQETDRVKQELFQPIESALQQARDEDVPTFAPNLFAKANRYYRQAEKDYQKGERLNKIRKQLKSAEEYLSKAVAATKISKVALADILQIRRQVLDHELIRKKAPNKFAEAERKSNEAILKAEAGNIRSASDKADDAAKKYREATHKVLMDGSLKEAEERLKQSKKSMSSAKYKRAKKELAALKNTLKKAKNQDFEISTLVTEISSKISEIESNYSVSAAKPQRNVSASRDHKASTTSAGRRRGRDQRCKQAVQPRVFDVEISAPAPAYMFSQASFYYASGKQLDIVLSIPTCTEISGVQFDDLELQDKSHSMETSGAYYTVQSDVRESDNRHRITIRLYLSDMRVGRSKEVSIMLKSKIGFLSAKQEFTLVKI